jgi:hypothetical protein
MAQDHARFIRAAASFTHAVRQAQEQGFVDKVTDDDDAWIQRLYVLLLLLLLLLLHCCMPRPRFFVQSSRKDAAIFAVQESSHQCCRWCRYKEQEEAGRQNISTEADGSDGECGDAGDAEHLIIEDDAVEIEQGRVSLPQTPEVSLPKAAVGHESA